MGELHRNPPGITEHQLRVYVLDEELDNALTNLTEPKGRSYLPELLSLFSDRIGVVNRGDRRPDGYSLAESQLGQYQHSVQNYSQVRWKLGGRVETEREDGKKRGLIERVDFDVRMGVEAVQRLIAPPMFDRTEINDFDSEDGSLLLPFHYEIIGTDTHRNLEPEIREVRRILGRQVLVGGLALVSMDKPYQTFWSSQVLSIKRQPRVLS